MKGIKTVDSYGTIRYMNEKGIRHRENGPAIINKKGSKWWFNKGELHREDGPAVEFVDGTVMYYLDNLRFTKEEWEDEIIKKKLERVKIL